MIINNVVHGASAHKIPGHLSFGQHIVDVFREYAHEENKIALINGETGHKITFKQIFQGLVNVASSLRKLGIKRGNVVGICSGNRDELLPTAMGVICAGATLTTFNMQYSKDELIHTLNIAKPSVIFCSEEALAHNYDVLSSSPFIKKIIQFNGKPVSGETMMFADVITYADVNEFEPADVNGFTDVVLILYSSGTTGLPKGVKLNHVNLLYSAASNDIRADINLTIVPWYHVYGLMSTLNYMLARRLQVYLAGFNPKKYLTAIQKYKPTILLAVPPIVVFLGKSPMVKEFDLSSVTTVWCGAAPLTSETIAGAMKCLPNCKGIFQAYGMTETSLAATKHLEDKSSSKIGSGGCPLQGVKMKVVDIETRKKLGPYKQGEICLKGPIIMQGYLGDEAASWNVLDDEGFLKTGDIGYYDDDGYIFIVDRLKELIKYKGNQVPPAIVESVILQHAGVAECGVVGLPDEAAGELATAAVRLKPGVSLTPGELMDFANQRLSKINRLYGGVVFVDEIPKNLSGKLLRRVLKQRLMAKQRSKL